MPYWIVQCTNAKAAQRLEQLVRDTDGTVRILKHVGNQIWIRSEGDYFPKSVLRAVRGEGLGSLL